MPKTLTLMFGDLNSKAQKEVLEFYGYENPTEGNFDIVPLFVLEKTEDDEADGRHGIRHR